MSFRTITGRMVAALVLLAIGCGSPITSPEEHGAAVLESAGKKPSSESTGSSTADLSPGDFLVEETSPAPLASSCPGGVQAGNYHVDFGHTECMVVCPLGSAYCLRDDVKFIVTKEKGKNGRITHVRLYAQDVIGDAGIGHETADIPVAIPAVPIKQGFTLHVHARNIPVWRLDSHGGDGNRVEVIGTISIGDIIYH